METYALIGGIGIGLTIGIVIGTLLTMRVFGLKPNLDFPSKTATVADLYTGGEAALREVKGPNWIKTATVPDEYVDSGPRVKW